MRAIILVFLPALATAHFQILSPVPRGYSEDTLAKFPCGGQDTPSNNRSMFPVGGGPIQLNMEHDRSAVQVLLALGNDVGSNFNVTLQPIFLEQGIGKFCMGDVVVPGNLGIKDGMNGTIQVVTNGDPTGGLYNCADITFSSSTTAGQCNNGTGIQATAYKGTNTNANSTDSGSASASPSGTATSSTSTTTGPKAAAAGKLEMALGFILTVAAIVGALLS